MDYYSVKRLGLILAIQAEIEGMKAKNQDIDAKRYRLVYDETDFYGKAQELRNISYTHDEQL
jgi:hypothetical protein